MLLGPWVIGTGKEARKNAKCRDGCLGGLQGRESQASEGGAPLSSTATSSCSIAGDLDRRRRCLFSPALLSRLRNRARFLQGRESERAEKKTRLVRRWETSTSSFPPLLSPSPPSLLFFLSRRRLCLFSPELSSPPETEIPGFCGGFSRGDTIL